MHVVNVERLAAGEGNRDAEQTARELCRRGDFHGFGKRHARKHGDAVVFVPPFEQRTIRERQPGAAQRVRKLVEPRVPADFLHGEHVGPHSEHRAHQRGLFLFRLRVFVEKFAFFGKTVVVAISAQIVGGDAQPRRKLKDRRRSRGSGRKILQRDGGSGIFQPEGNHRGA